MGSVQTKEGTLIAFALEFPPEAHQKTTDALAGVLTTTVFGHDKAGWVCVL